MGYRIDKMLFLNFKTEERFVVVIEEGINIFVDGAVAQNNFKRSIAHVPGVQRKYLQAMITSTIALALLGKYPFLETHSFAAQFLSPGPQRLFERFFGDKCCFKNRSSVLI